MIFELLGMVGIGAGILKAADGVQSATNRGVRKATRAVSNAPAKLGKFLDQVDSARGVHPPERDYSMCAHQDEVIEEDGPYLKVRCRKCKRTAGGCA